MSRPRPRHRRAPLTGINTGRRLGRGRDVRSGRAVRQGQRDSEEGERGKNQCLNQIAACLYSLVDLHTGREEGEGGRESFGEGRES